APRLTIICTGTGSSDGGALFRGALLQAAGEIPLVTRLLRQADGAFCHAGVCSTFGVMPGDCAPCGAPSLCVHHPPLRMDRGKLSQAPNASSQHLVVSERAQMSSHIDLAVIRE